MISSFGRNQTIEYLSYVNNKWFCVMVIEDDNITDEYDDVDYNILIVSDDFKRWQPADIDGKKEYIYEDIVYSNGVYCCYTRPIEESDHIVYYSTDGIKWLRSDLVDSTIINQLVAGSGVFLCNRKINLYTNQLSCSTNGKDWFNIPILTDGDQILDIRNVNDTWYIVMKNGIDVSTKILTTEELLLSGD